MSSRGAEDRWLPTGAVKEKQNFSSLTSHLQTGVLLPTCNTHTSVPAQVECLNIPPPASDMQSVTLHMTTRAPHHHHHSHSRSQHTTVLGVTICHAGKNLQSFSVCRRLRLTAFLWKFMSRQLWPHPPVQTLKTTPSRELWGDPIHYTPPGNFSECACMCAHVSHLLRVSEHPSAWLTVSLFLPSCARSCPTSCGFDCQHVCKSFCIHLAKLWRFSCRSEHHTLFIWGRERCFLWATVSEFLFDEVIKKLLYYSGKQMKTLYHIFGCI